MMKTDGRSAVALLRRSTKRSLLMGLLPGSGAGALLAGCGAAAGVGAAIVIALLTGLFLTRIQASIAATARSYAFTEVGDVQLGFIQPNSNSNVLLTSLSGRLPGFHLIIIDGDLDKAAVAAQTADGQPEIFETEAEIDFLADPPTLSGTVRQVSGGDARSSIPELYPEIVSVTQDVGPADSRGNRLLTIRIVAQGAEGEELEYTLEMRIKVTLQGSKLTGTVHVQRIVTLPGDETITVEADGSLEGDKQNTGASDAPDDDDQANDSTGGDESDNDNTDSGDELENENSNGNESEDEDLNDNSNDSSQGEPEPSIDEVCPGLSGPAVFVVNQILEAFGFEGFDIDQDGFVTAQEVEEVVNASITPLTIAEESAQCIATVSNLTN